MVILRYDSQGIGRYDSFGDPDEQGHPIVNMTLREWALDKLTELVDMLLRHRDPHTNSALPSVFSSASVVS